jgi:hypothetical protein
MEASGKLHAPVALPPPPGWKFPRYPLDRRLGDPQSSSGRGGKEKTLPAPAGNRVPVAQLVAWSLYSLNKFRSLTRGIDNLIYLFRPPILP